MNKTELAKLLIKHPEIKALYESQAFDTSTINKVIAEEIVREQEDADDDDKNEPIAPASQDLQDLKDDIANAQTMADLGELEKEVKKDHPRNKALIKALEKAKQRIESGSSNDTEIDDSEGRPNDGSDDVSNQEDAAKKEAIESMKSEIEFFKTLLNDPDELPLDKKEYQSTIDEYIQKLEQMGVAVAKTDSKEDDKAFVQSLQASKPEIEQLANDVKATDEDDDNFAEKFSDLDAAIIASLQKVKSDAKAANNELDLNDIEIVDNEESDLTTQTISSVAQDVSAVDVAKTIGTLALDVGKNLLPAGIKNSLQTGLDFLNNQELWLKAAESAVKGNYDDSAEIVATELVEKVQERFELASFEEGSVLKTITIAAMKPALSTGIKLAVESGADNVIDGAKELYSDAKETIEQAFTPTEEGTQEAVEAIEGEVPENVENIEPADVQAAEEQLESEIEASPEMQANAQELETKVEKNKMANKVNYSGPFNGIIQNNPDNPESVVEEAQRRLEIYDKASNWEDEDLNKLHPSISKKENLPDFETWKQSAKNYMGNKAEEFKVAVQKLNSSNDDATKKQAADELEKIIVDADSGFKALDDAINNVAGDEIGGDSTGSDVQGQTDLETIAKILPDLKDKLPNLFKFDGFVKNLAQALMNAEPSSDASDGDGDGVEATGTPSTSDTNIASNIDSGTIGGDSGGEANLPEALSGIYLAEEEGVSDVTNKTTDDESGKPLDVDAAVELKKELEALRNALEPKNINVDDLLTPDLKKALGIDPEEETETNLDGETDGNEAAETDAQREAATFAETYAALIPSMDNFFSTEQATRLGFMEQFLLESQSAMLWDLIGNLTKIAEKGKARAFSKRKEKEEAGMSGLGSPEEQGDLQREAIGDFLKRNKEPVEISKEDQISLKTDLKALLQTLRATKSMIRSYEENMTKVSVDPGLDGSALKEKLDQYLPMVQKSIAKIVERANEAFIKATKLNAPRENPEVTQPATSGNLEEMNKDELVEAILEAFAPAYDGVYSIMEDSRDETINFVDGIYNEMLKIYAPVGKDEDSEGLRGFMQAGDRARSIQQAERMLEVATKEEFTKLFPGGRIGEGGMPATVNGAIETLGREIKKLVLIMRDVVSLASQNTIPHSKLIEIVSSLTTISKSIYNSFGAKMMISGKTFEQIEERSAEDENNKSLTDTPSKPGLMDKAKELAGKGLDKLKQMFGWISDEVQQMIDTIQTPLPVLKPMIDAIDLSEKSDEWKNQTLQDAMQAAMWFNTLEDDEQQALTIYGKFLIDKEAQISEGSNDRNRFYGELNAAGVQFADGSGTRKRFKKAYKAVKEKSEDLAKTLDKLMTKHTETLVQFFVFTIGNMDLATELFKLLEEIPTSSPTPSSKRNADEPTVSADVELDDEEVKSLDWYRSLDRGEQAAVQSFATNLLNLLRRSGKAQDLNLIDEDYQKFFADLKNKYGREDVGKEMSRALNSMKAVLKIKVTNLMEKQPEQFSQFVYDLTTSTDLGDAIFGATPEQPKPKTASDADMEEIKKKELIDFISKKSMGMSKDPGRGFAEFLNKYYLPETVDNDRVIKTGYDKMYSKSKELSQDQKKCLFDWVVEIRKRIGEALSSGKNVKSEGMHPSDYFAAEFRDKLRRLNVSTKGIKRDDLFAIVNNALTTVAETNDLRSYWLGQINDKEKAEETSNMLATLVRIHRSHKINGLYAMIFQKLPTAVTENDIIKMYNSTVKNYEDRLKTDQDYEASKALDDDDSLEFDDENDSIEYQNKPLKGIEADLWKDYKESKRLEESLKPVIEAMLKKRYNH